jgi:hypothetical protein
MATSMRRAPVVGGKRPPFLELHPHIDEEVIAVFSQPGAMPMPLENGLLYRWTLAYHDPIPGARIRKNAYANNVRLSVFDGDFYIAQETL